MFSSEHGLKLLVQCCSLSSAHAGFRMRAYASSDLCSSPGEFLGLWFSRLIIKHVVDKYFREPGPVTAASHGYLNEKPAVGLRNLKSRDCLCSSQEGLLSEHDPSTHSIFKA